MAFSTVNYILSTLALTSHMLMALSATNDSVLMLSYGDVDIHFDLDTFERFYKCLCNTVMSPCNARTPVVSGPVKHINAINIEQFYNKENSRSGAKQCRIDKSDNNNQLLYTISCLFPDKENKACHYNMTLLSQPDDNNNCISPFVEIGWVQGFSNITIRHVRGRTLQLKECRNDIPAECKNITEVPIVSSELMFNSNIYYVLISSNCCFILLVIILASILIYKTKGTNMCCIKEKNVRVNEDGHYRNCTVDYCNQPTVYESENLERENHFLNSFSNPINTFQKTLHSEEENFQEECCASLNIKTYSNEETHRLRNTLVKTNSFVERCLYNPECSPDRENIMSSGDIEVSINTLDVNNSRVLRIEHDTNTPAQKRNKSKTKPKSCIKTSYTTIDNKDYSIVHYYGDVHCPPKVRRNTNRALPIIQEINNEVSNNHTSQGLPNIKCKSNQTRLERPLIQKPYRKDQVLENNDTITSPTSLCDGYEVSIIKDGLCHNVNVCENDTKRNSLAKNTMTPVGSLDDDVDDVATVNSRPDATWFSGISKPEIVFLPLPGASDTQTHERNTQSRFDESQTAFD